MLRSLILALALAAPPALAAGAGCGGETVCKVEDGAYRILFPEGRVEGVYVFFHGYKSSAALQVKQKAIVDTVLAHHLAFAAPDGVEGSWSIPAGPERARDDRAYALAVLDDLKTRFGFTPDKTLVGGFSLGASMAWYTVCRDGGRAAAMLTFSGVFWDPLPRPADCVKDLPPMIHIHGRADGTFPLSGRAIGGSYHQGDTVQSVAIYRDRAACDKPKPFASEAADLECETAPGCVMGESRLCLHPGGHQVRPGDLDRALTTLGYAR